MSGTLLSISRISKSTVFTRHAARSLATEAHPFSDSTSRNSSLRPKRNRLESQPNSIYVRAWDEIDSMPALFALVRGIEKRFGQVREFRVTRDYDISTSYAHFFIAEFKYPDAIERVPENGTHIKVEVPLVPRHRPGGVGLDELQGLLEADDWDPTLASGKQVIKALPSVEEERSMRTRVVELIVQRTKGYKADPREAQRSRHAVPFGLAFYQWGGFYRPSTADAPPVPEVMQQVLAKWQRKADRQSVADTRTPRRTGAPARKPDSQDSENVEDIDFMDCEAAQRAQEEQEANPVNTSAPSESTDSAPSVTSAASSEPVASSETVAQPAATEQPERPKRLSQREKILMLARMHAKTPLEEAKAEVEAEVEKQAEEEQAQEQAKAAEEEEKKATLGGLRNRLLRILGKLP
ncbi:hypothetical protein BN946_scf184985.g48 [Trametes cinnabarina]|uniref:Uncharacterized protein n=1 Tax=Pycnoporus cinnabarinus TaxID=5643 RepID=A0A060SK63_PYCCI|nr:hypothetical protein BN946_scf184985.g48 [Trametes cinnabarina]